MKRIYIIQIEEDVTDEFIADDWLELPDLVEMHLNDFNMGDYYYNQVEFLQKCKIVMSLEAINKLWYVIPDIRGYDTYRGAICTGFTKKTVIEFLKNELSSNFENVVSIEEIGITADNLLEKDNVVIMRDFHNG